jgi:hypothetical protein
VSVDLRGTIDAMKVELQRIDQKLKEIKPLLERREVLNNAIAKLTILLDAESTSAANSRAPQPENVCS